MRHNPRALLILMTTLAMFSGCNQSDERLVELSRESLQTQRQQNQAIAEQSSAVVKESHELAVAAKELVSQDAVARKEVIVAHQRLQGQLQQERSGVDRQREVLEAERRAIASQRQWDPVLAAALQGTATVLACLAPLALVAYLLHQFGPTCRSADELDELLLAEFTAIPPSFRSALLRRGCRSAIDLSRKACRRLSNEHRAIK